MGKFFRRINRYAEEDYENEFYEDDDMPEDDEIDDEDYPEEEDEDSDRDYSSDGEDDDYGSDEEEDTEDEDGDYDSYGESEGYDSNEEDLVDEDEDYGSGEDEGYDSDEEDSEEEDGDYGSGEDEGYDSDEEDPEDEDRDYDSDDDEEEWEEDDRRAYRRRRRIRNQLISYSVVLVILAALITGGVIAGKNILGVVKEKKQAAQQEELKAQMQAEKEAQEAHDVVIEAPIEMEEEPEEDHVGELVDSYISTMPLEDKVAALFIVTPEAITGVSTAIQAGDGTQEALKQYAVGGLIYFSKNIIDKEQITKMLSSTTTMSKYPIFLGVDEEGGSVSRVADSSVEVIEVGDMAAIGASGDTAQAYETGLTIGTYLKELGFNLNFAPVADLAGSEDGILGDRVFGSDAQLVGEMVSNTVEGLEGTGVSSCLKHFPGIGDTTGDTHKGRVETDKTLDEMRAADFLSFKAGIDAGADFVMVSHVTVASLGEEAVPSSLSKTIMTDILREELGFQGVIITDALDMGAITEYYTTEEAVVQAVEAGADMLLMPEDFQKAYDALLAAVQDGTISEERLNASLERIYRVKCANKLEFGM